MPESNEMSGDRITMLELYCVIPAVSGGGEARWLQSTINGEVYRLMMAEWLEGLHNGGGIQKSWLGRPCTP